MPLERGGGSNMTKADKKTQLFAVVLVGAEEGDIENPLVRATSSADAISAALHDPRWEGYACTFGS